MTARLAWLVVLAVVLGVGRGHAQPSDQAPQVAPPRALVVPPIAWPTSLPLPPEGAFEALLVVGKDGLAQVEGCAEAAEVCEALDAALIEASFAPALSDGVPVHARVRVRFAVHVAPKAPAADSSSASSAAAGGAPSHAASEPTRGAEAQAPSAGSAPSDGGGDFGAIARVRQTPPTAHALELEEMRSVPGAFGDPFRVIDALPGVVPVMTGLPYVYVRGAPPAATAYFYDDIQLPALFHLALGPAVVHPAMVGPIEFYPGVAPARYGRRTGGTVAGQAAYRPLKPGLHGELELRLVDTQLYLAAPFGEGGRVEVGGRYGYPGLVVKLFEPSSVVQYWDYQARSRIPLGASTELAIVALGSFDMIGRRTERGLERDLELQFHRVELRAITHKKRLDIGYAFTFGFERSGLAEDFDITALRFGPRLWLDTRLGRARLRLGGDMLATSGSIEDPLAEDDDEDSSPQNPIYRSATGRSVFGVYAELGLPLGARWDVEAGLRSDVWITGGDPQAALEPRLLLRHRPHERIAVHGAFGLAYQPAVFLIPLPGVADVALDRGLQRAIQTEVGTAFELPSSFSLEAKAFAHLYDDMLSFDAIDADDCEDFDGESCEESDSFARMSAYAYGGEFMLRRAFKERVSGWLAYTLSKADGETAGGRPLTPSFDVRHVGNLVLQWRISQGWHVALRGYGQSGRFPLGASTSADPRERARLPPFFRGDLQLSRLWRKSWGELRFSFEWMNFTFQREPLAWDCTDHERTRCKVEYLEFPITLPMLGVRASY